MIESLSALRRHLCLAGIIPVLFSVSAIDAATQKVPVRHAENLQIARTAGGFVVEVSVPSGEERKRGPVYTYGLRRDHDSRFDGLEDTFAIPVAEVVPLSTTYLHPIIHLGGRETIVAVAAFEHPYDPALRARAKAGKLIEVGMNASANLERLVALRPDVVFTSAPYTYTGNSLISQLERYRVPVAATAAYLEATPLARAEWGLFFGAFYDALPAAREQFAAVEARYLRLKQAVAEHLAAGAKRPSVLTDAPWGDTWWVPGGASYMAQLIEDAGGTYIFDDNESLAGIPMSLESILRAGREADFWINPGAFSSMNALRDADPRMMRFDAFAAGQVYNNNRRLNPHGGNDIWERGIGQPDEILADLIAILHPEVLPDRDLVFYQRLE